MPDELDPRTRAKLDVERGRPGPSAMDVDAIRAGVRAKLDAAPETPRIERAAMRPRVGAIASAAFVIGGALGALLGAYAGASLRAPVTVYVDRPGPTVERIVPAPPVPAPAESTSASATPTIRPAPARPTTTLAPRPAARDDLAAERTLIDRARSALARGDSAGALDAVALHVAQFPRGALAEEREFIAVQALLRAGRLDDARARGANFHAQFPASPLLPVLDESLAKIH